MEGGEGTKRRLIAPRTVKEVTQFRLDPGRPLFSATPEEILAGWTTDVYFVKTQEILDHLGLAQTPVVAEIFPRREGLLAGVEECRRLLQWVNDTRPSDWAPLTVWALREGDVFGPKEVVMRIEGPYGLFGIYETALLGILASSSAWASAARLAKEAAGGKPVYSFGARHVHPAVAPVMERAAIVGGADGAACILAAKLAGQTPVGTVPHALFLIIGDSLETARAYHAIMPPDEPRTILVDTFKDEAEEAVRVAQGLGKALGGVRLDTPSERGGVTPDLVREVRYRLNQAGFNHVRILISGGLTPEKIASLADAGADAFGVGSFISAAPPIDMTMDLKEVAGKPMAKRGRLPGRQDNPRLLRII